MAFWIWVCQESCSIEDQVYHTKKVLSCCFCKQFSTIRILCIQIFHLALLCYFWRLLRFLHRWNCPCLLKRSKDPDRRGVVRTEFANVLKLDFTAHDREHYKSILLCSCIHPCFPVNCLILTSCHICSDIILPYFTSSPKAEPVSFKISSSVQLSQNWR